MTGGRTMQTIAPHRIAYLSTHRGTRMGGDWETPPKTIYEKFKYMQFFDFHNVTKTGKLTKYNHVNI
ncbi:MAG: hypothetical protein ROR55_17825 [Devosia sp.]